MRLARLFIFLLSVALLAPASAHPPAKPKRPRTDVDITSPVDGFSTKGDAAFQVETEIQSATWRKKAPKANFVVAMLYLDGKVVAHQSARTKPLSAKRTSYENSHLFLRHHPLGCCAGG